MAAVHHGTRYSKEATDRYVDVNGIKIHYNEAGQGPALFCFHGGGPGANAWDNSKHNLDELADRGAVRGGTDTGTPGGQAGDGRVEEQ